LDSSIHRDVSGAQTASCLELILWGVRTCISGSTKAWTEPGETGSSPTLARLGTLLTSRSTEYKPLQADDFRRTLTFQNSTKDTSVASQILPHCRRIQPSAPKNVKTESWLVQACTFLHLCPTLQRVGEMQPALAKPHSSCSLHHQHRRNVVYSVAGASGMCSQSGPLLASIIQVMKGSPCTRNTRASLDIKPKSSRTFHYQHLGKMALTVLMSPVLQLSDTWYGSLGLSTTTRSEI